MRGPGLRISTDVRRLWRCPACGYERKVPKTETSVPCSCTSPPPLMKLIEGQRVVRPEPRPVDRFFEETDFPEDPPQPQRPAPPPKAARPAAPVEAAPVEAAPVAIESPVSREPATEETPNEAAAPSSTGKKKRRRRSKKGASHQTGDSPDPANTAAPDSSGPSADPTASDFGAGLE